MYSIVFIKFSNIIIISSEIDYSNCFILKRLYLIQCINALSPNLICIYKMEVENGVM